MRNLILSTGTAMDRAEQHQSSSRSSNCSSSLRLYSGTSYTGSVTSITARNTWVNLSSYGADNTTSSYKVGACSSSFRAGSFGSGSSYPGNTSSYTSQSSMAWGWDNVVSSIRLS